MNKKTLSIYLNDHLAGSIAGVELAKRAAGSNEGTEWGPFLDRLCEEIEEDRQSLMSLMTSLGIRQDLLKDAAAWLGEKVGRLKMNGQIVGYSDLSRLVELEGLMIGIQGKLALWRTLQSLEADRIDTGGLDLVDLEQRAIKQLDELEDYRKKAALGALA